MHFSGLLLSVLVYGSVVLAALAGLTLLYLLVRDILKKAIW